MPYDIRYDADHECVVCRVTGKWELHHLKACLADLAQQMKRYDCLRVLHDMREAEPVMSLVDLYDIPRLAIESGIPPGSKRALLFSASPEDIRFLETASFNVMQNVVAFTGMDEAMAWLRE